MYEIEVVDKSIIEMTDALSKTYSLSVSGKGSVLKRYVYRLEKDRIHNFEKQVIKDFKKVVLVSESDREYLGNASNVCVYSNGVDLYNKKRPLNRNKIVFVGNMRTLQNQDAVLFFINSIFPELSKKHNELEFHVVGAQPSKEIMRLESEKIHITGFVADLEEYISDAVFSIAPVRIAAGIQNKVLKSMACNVPVILSDTIAKGIPGLETGVNCMIASTEKEYIEACEKLIDSETVRNDMANAGFDFIRNNYNWEKMLLGYEELASR